MQSFTNEQLRIIQAVEELAVSSATPVYVVGGVLRDFLLGYGVQHCDLDFIVEGDAHLFCNKVAGIIGGDVRAFKEFFTAKLLEPASVPSIAEIDFATARTETYTKPGVLPSVSTASIQDDLRRRDFTINALAVSVSDLNRFLKDGAADRSGLSTKLHDYFEGQKDLEGKVLRILHERSFIDDPTRIFRACRYAVRIGGTLATESEQLLKAAVQSEALNTISYFRKFTELKKIFSEECSAAIIELLAQYGVFSKFKLYAEAKAETVFNALRALDTLSVPKGDDVKYNVALRIFFDGMDSSDRAEQFHEYGFGKKLIRHVIADLENSKAIKVAAELSDEALVLGLLWGVSQELEQELRSEMCKRGLIGGEYKKTQRTQRAAEFVTEK
ncbi:hypothetical protein OAO01_03870 [Oligoflexia bacterium]|nr:hypothetical protein [Oligoflexia bacterium]